MFPMSSSSPSNSSADTGLMKLRKRKEPTSTKIIFDIFPLLGLAACKVLVSTDRAGNTCSRYCQPQLLSRNLTPGTGSNCQLISKVLWADESWQLTHVTSNDIHHFFIWATYVHTKDFLLEMSSRREPVLRQSSNHQTRCATLHLMYLTWLFHISVWAREVNWSCFLRMYLCIFEPHFQTR